MFASVLQTRRFSVAISHFALQIEQAYQRFVSHPVEQTFQRNVVEMVKGAKRASRVLTVGGTRLSEMNSQFPQLRIGLITGEDRQQLPVWPALR